MPSEISGARGPLEPNPCVTQGRLPARSSVLPSAVIVIVVITAWTTLVACGISAQVATAGLGSVAGLGLHITARLAGRSPGRPRA